MTYLIQHERQVLFSNVEYPMAYLSCAMSSSMSEVSIIPMSFSLYDLDLLLSKNLSIYFIMICITLCLFIPLGFTTRPTYQGDVTIETCNHPMHLGGMRSYYPSHIFNDEVIRNCQSWWILIILYFQGANMI